MIKCSANYCKSNNNFTIKGIKETKDKIEYIQTIKIIKNIINRGSTTITSNFLKEHYNYNIKEDQEDYKLISSEDVVWKNTIKGRENSLDNPALEFFDKVIEEYLGEYSFVKKLILPETPINEIIEYPKEEFENMSVDFYIPQINKVIEIDGIQHQYTKYEDRLRDELHKENVIRIKTKDIRNRTEELKDKMRDLKESLKKSACINQYKQVFENSYINQEKVELIQIIRLELTILELLKFGMLNLNDNWNLQIIGVKKEIVELAIQDLRNWFEMIFKLQKIKIKMPDYNINQETLENIIIDIDIFKRYDDSCFAENVIYVRNDYFENEQKNYYRVECDENYRYKLNHKNKEDEENLNKILTNIFGHENFREGQSEIIMNLLNLNDTIGILPTGTGKSLCYQMGALLQPGITFIICPLKSLIKDQKDNMSRVLINNNEKIDSTMTGSEKAKALNKIKKAKYQMIWVSPERFQSEDFRDTLSHINKNYGISYAIIDEVHCMSEWGHNFRTSYLPLVKTIKNYVPSATLVGLTATASDRVLKDLKIEFEITDESNIITTLNFIRKELSFRVYNCDEMWKEQILFDIIDNLQQKRNVLEAKGIETNSGLVFSPFAGGQRGCEALSNKLSEKYPEYKNNIGFFVGKKNIQSDKEKEEIQDEYKNNKKTLLIATKSFGMGIDKENIRYIIHFGIPSSIESLYQEVGRAGRDGKAAICYIIHALPKYEGEKEKEILFRTNSTIQQIRKELLKNGRSSWERGDVFDQMELFMKDKNENEVDSIFETYQKYIKGNKLFEIKLRTEEGLSLTEKNIYKLGLLGIVTDWTVTYNPGLSIRGKALELNNKEIEKNIENYINKYEYNFSFNNLDEKKDKSIIDILKEENQDNTYKYIKIICTWYYENILYSRRRAIEQIDSFITSLKSNEDCTEDFNKVILDYFRPDDYNLILKYIGETEEDYISALQLLLRKKDKIDFQKIQSIKTSLDRILITNRYNSVLNLLEGILKIYLNINDRVHEEDFEYAIEKVSKLKNNEEIYKEILKVCSQMTEDMKLRLNEKLLKYFNSLENLITNYKYLKTKEVLNKVIKIENERIIEIERRILNGFGKNE